MTPNGVEGTEPDGDDAVWKALAHPLRRRLLDHLRDGPQRTGELAERFEESRHVVMQHLNVLREADLVRTSKRGRTRINHLNPVPIQRIHRRWVSRYEAPWAEALLGMQHQLEEEHDDETTIDEEGRNVG